MMLRLIGLFITCIYPFIAEAQEIHLYRDHILYHQAPKGKIEDMRVLEFYNPYSLLERGMFTHFNYTKEGQLQSIETINVDNSQLTKINFQYVNEREISWEKKQSENVLISGKIIIEKEKGQLKRISNYESGSLVEVTTYGYKEGGITNEVINIYKGRLSRRENEYIGDQLSSSIHYDTKLDQVEATSRYSYIGDTTNIQLFDSTGNLLPDRCITGTSKNNSKGVWVQLERQFVLSKGEKLTIYRQINYADDDQIRMPDTFIPGDWYSYLFKPNVLFFEFNEDGTYDFGYQGVIFDNGSYQVNENQLFLQSAFSGRSGTFEMTMEAKILNLNPVDDEMQFFYPFLLRLGGGGDPNEKIKADEYSDFLDTYVKLIYGG